MRSAILLCTFLASFTSQARANVNCDSWGTPEFAMTASVDLIETCISTGASLTETYGEEGWTVFHQIVSDNPDLAVMTAMINAGTELNRKDAQNATPFMRAIWANRGTDVLSLLVEAGALTQEPYEDEFSPLHLAAKSRQHDSLIFLLSLGVDPDPVADGMTPLAHVVTWTRRDPYRSDEIGHDVLKLRIHDSFFALKEAGANLRFEPAEGKSLFERAVWNVTDPEIIRAFLAVGASINVADSSGWTPLHRAARWMKDNYIIPLFIEVGADINARTDDGKRPIDMGFYTDAWPEMVPALLEMGLKLGTDPVDRFNTLSFVACDEDKLVFLQGLGMDVTRRGPNGETLLHHLPDCVYGEIPLDWLIDAGLDVNALDTDGNTPLMSAVNQDIYGDRSGAVVTALARAGADPYIRNAAGLSPLEWALINYPSAVEQLVTEFDMDMTRRNESGDTILHWALSLVGKGDAEGGVRRYMISELIELGADPNTPDHAGQTPMHLAVGDANFLALDLAKDLRDGGALPSLPDANGNLPIHLLLLQRADATVNMRVNQLKLNEKLEVPQEIAERLEQSLGQLNQTMEKNFDPQRQLQIYLSLIGVLVPDRETAITPDGSGRLPLNLAISTGQPVEVIEALLEQGAHPNHTDGLGRTALHTLAVTGDAIDEDILRVLLVKDPDFTVRDTEGQLAVEIATNTITDVTMRDSFIRVDREHTIFWQRWFR